MHHVTSVKYTGLVSFEHWIQIFITMVGVIHFKLIDLKSEIGRQYIILESSTELITTISD